MRRLANLTLVNWLHIKDSRFSAIGTVIICLCWLSALFISHDAMAGTLVVVPPGFEEVGGSSVGMRDPHLGSSVIWQEVYPASEFLGVPAGQNAILAMRLRPDSSNCVHREPQMEMYELRLSTTDAVPGTLDRVFDQNRGDDEVVVYRGPLRWETDCSGPPEGPRDFDYIVDLQTAFPYDPSWGRSLLVEEHASFQTNVAPFTDTHDFPGQVRAIASLPHAASVAQYHIERAFVRGFEFATLPGDFDHNGVLDVADVNLLQQEIVAGPPGAEFDLNSDDRVDGEDLRIWVKDLKHTWIGDANLDREFSSGDLIVVFQAGEYEDDVLINSTWGTGDWNGDAEFDSSDLVTAFQDGGYERGPRPAVATVPEPNSIPLFLAGLVFFLFPTGARL